MSTFDDERRMQPYMDSFYKLLGYSSIDRSKSCKQFDCIIEKNNKPYKVEEKYLFCKVYKQLLVELIQDIKSADMGWFYHVDCDCLVWAYCNEDRTSEPNKIYIIKWGLFKKYVIENISNVTWTQVNICTKNYGITLNWTIKWDDLMEQDIATPYPFDYPIPF